MTSAAGLALAAALHQTEQLEAAPSAIEALVHDEVQESRAFSRGRSLGASAAGSRLQGADIFESEVIASPFPFTHTGLHWAGRRSSSLEDFQVEARTSVDGQVWSEWLAASVEAEPSETPAGETYAALLGAPRHNFLQYRTSHQANERLLRLTATFLNTLDGPQTSPLAAAAISSNPAIDRTRADWGCDESLRFRNGREIWPRMYVPVKKLVVHHTATERLLTTDAEIEAEMRAIYTYHARTLGWGDIGYGALIGLNGKSYEGRYGRGSGSSREIFSQDVVAGHAYEHNYGTAGVALIGWFHPPYNMEPTTVMLDRLLDVLERVGLDWQLDPHAASDFLKSTGSWNRGLANLCGHRNCVATACPGDSVYSKLGWLRDQLATRLTTGSAPILESPAPSLTGPDGITTTNRNLSYAWAGGNGTSYSYYLEGWSKTSSSEAVTYISGFDSSSRPSWSSWSTSTESKSFTRLKPGHYTLHVRSRDSAGIVSYQRNQTAYLR